MAMIPAAGPSDRFCAHVSMAVEMALSHACGRITRVPKAAKTTPPGCASRNLVSSLSASRIVESCDSEYENEKEENQQSGLVNQLECSSDRDSDVEGKESDEDKFKSIAEEDDGSDVIMAKSRGSKNRPRAILDDDEES